MFLTFDTETSGKIDFDESPTTPGQPRIVSMGMVLFDDDGVEVSDFHAVIKPEGFAIPADTVAIHGITTEYALKYGMSYDAAWYLAETLMYQADHILIFNESYDRNMTNIESWIRHGNDSYLQNNQKKIRCMMQVMAGMMKLPGYYGDYKWPKLDEAYEFLFHEKPTGAHNSVNDARATGWIAQALRNQGLWDFNS